jgi:hypothetical protein
VEDLVAKEEQAGRWDQGLVVGDAKGGGKVGVEFAGLEAVEADDVPEGAGDVAAQP